MRERAGAHTGGCQGGEGGRHRTNSAGEPGEAAELGGRPAGATPSLETSRGPQAVLSKCSGQEASWGGRAGGSL